MNCRVDKPYPKVRVFKKSRETADVLTHIYASDKSELTAVLQYSYETFLMEDSSLKTILQEIARVEMHHLQILGELISLLGEMPMYVDSNFCNKSYWNADYVYYDTDIPTMLEINIESEKSNIRNYQMALTVIEDKYIEEIIKRILEDEYLHLEIFMKLRQNFK